MRYRSGHADFAEMAAELSSGKEHKFPPGTPAPDFALRSLRNGHVLRLSDFRNRKPVVLVFGSFGCEAFCKHLPRLNSLAERYNTVAEFIFVYTFESPHQPPIPLPTGPGTKATRIERGLLHFNVTFPCFLAEDTPAIQSAYSALPERLFILDRRGCIAVDAGHGLDKGWDFDALGMWLKEQSLPDDR